MRQLRFGEPSPVIAGGAILTRNLEQQSVAGGFSGRVLFRVGRLAWVWEADAVAQPNSRRRGLRVFRTMKALALLRRRRKPPGVHWEQEHRERKQGLPTVYGHPPEASGAAYLMLQALDREKRRRNID